MNLDTTINPESKRYGEMRGILENLVEAIRDPDNLAKKEYIEHLCCKAACKFAEHDGDSQ